MGARHAGDDQEPFFRSEGHKTGVISKKQDAPDEFLILHVCHRVEVELKDTDATAFVEVIAKDMEGKIWERQKYGIRKDGSLELV